jgi:uncharacterized CHY-type Zn-finger protein
MAGVDAKQKAEVFAALVANGLSFIERSAEELRADQKFSIAHFATGLELVLKARLFSEHWTLIAVSPHECNWTAIKAGTVVTVQASALCRAITTITGDSLQHEQEVFKQVFDHRNKVLHWLPHDDLAAVTAEQCRAWYALYRLLTQRWQKIFSESKQQIDRVEKTLRVHREYLQARFDALEPKLRQKSRAGAVERCPACQFQSAVLSEPTLQVANFECEVCESRGSLAHFPCGAWVPLNDLPVIECDACGEEHSKRELVELIQPPNSLSPKEMLDQPDPPHCGECLEYESNVVEVDDGYLCVDCGARFEPTDYSACEYCNEPWVGYDTAESYLMGCEFCDGRTVDDD